MHLFREGVPLQTTKVPEIISLDLITLAHCTIFQLYDKATEELCFFEPFKNLFDKQKDKRDRNNISYDTDRNCLHHRDIKK